MNARLSFVACEQCSHPIERHGMLGCLDCQCRELWNIGTIREARIQAGLPERYDGFRTDDWTQ